MKSTVFFIPCAVVVILLALSFRAINAGGNEEPWKPGQLLAPAELAKTIGDPAAKQPVVFSIGPGAVIKGSIDIGPARDSNNIKKFRQQLSQLPKDANIVIYCGCCPFVHCPNIRPAFTLLNEMKFTHPQLLNIEHNIKTDWIDKGYPVAK
jgi:thiosulfate/3-mercaptopyruvate sulfurtransferase